MRRAPRLRVPVKGVPLLALHSRAPIQCLLLGELQVGKVLPWNLHPHTARHLLRAGVLLDHLEAKTVLAGLRRSRHRLSVLYPKARAIRKCKLKGVSVGPLPSVK